MATDITTGPGPGDTDSAAAFEAKETANKLPVGWLVLFFGLILWGAFYLWTYSPSLGGWSQEGAYQRDVEQRSAEKK